MVVPTRAFRYWPRLGMTAEPPIPPHGSRSDTRFSMLTTRFQRQLTIATLGLFFVVLTIYLLREFAPILKPLLISVFILYIIYPIHRALVQRGVPSILAYVTILGLVIGLFLGVGMAVHSAFADLTPERLEEYERSLDDLLKRLLQTIGVSAAAKPGWGLRDLLASYDSAGKDAMEHVRVILSTFVSFLTTLLVVSIYLIFLVAEQVTFPERIRRAFGERRTNQILGIGSSINEAIAQYLTVKTFIGFLGAFLSLIVLWAFGIEFFVVWALLIFLLNYIPYIGSIAACGGPILLSLMQYPTELWKAGVITLLLIGIQLGTGQYVEPRMAGRRLNVSPLLILLSLSFWGFVWGIVGMILAVPLTMVAKIILDNIDETKPIATLMSNV
jgi:predicted PurR-regulated permease PerM